MSLKHVTVVHIAKRALSCFFAKCYLRTARKIASKSRGCGGGYGLLCHKNIELIKGLPLSLLKNSRYLYLPES